MSNSSATSNNSGGATSNQTTSSTTPAAINITGQWAFPEFGANVKQVGSTLSATAETISPSQLGLIDPCFNNFTGSVSGFSVTLGGTCDIGPVTFSAQVNPAGNVIGNSAFLIPNVSGTYSGTFQFLSFFNGSTITIGSSAGIMSLFQSQNGGLQATITFASAGSSPPNVQGNLYGNILDLGGGYARGGISGEVNTPINPNNLTINLWITAKGSLCDASGRCSLVATGTVSRE